MKTLSQVACELRKRNPEAMVILKTEKYGMWWAGKAKFISSAYTFEAGKEEVKAIENRSNGDIAVIVN